MHEYAFVKHVVESIQDSLSKQGNPGRVNKVMLRVGELELHSKEAFEQAFEMLAKGTPLEGSSLELEVVSARIECQDCGYRGPTKHGEADPHDPIPCAMCPACGKIVSVAGGRGVESIELELSDAGGRGA